HPMLPSTTLVVFLFLTTRRPHLSTLFPYTTLFRSYLLSVPIIVDATKEKSRDRGRHVLHGSRFRGVGLLREPAPVEGTEHAFGRSEEHTSELQSRFDLVCRLLLEKKKKDKYEAGDT